jgi:MoxR-like ATPase
VGVASRVVLGTAPALEAQLRSLAGRRLVFFAGLPGTGKSLLARSLVPTEEEAGAFIAAVERRDPDAADLEREIGRWWA